jgi:hypothetical protein
MPGADDDLTPERCACQDWKRTLRGRVVFLEFRLESFAAWWKRPGVAQLARTPLIAAGQSQMQTLPRETVDPQNLSVPSIPTMPTNPVTQWPAQGCPKLVSGFCSGDLYALPLESAFGTKSSTERQQITAELQARANCRHAGQDWLAYKSKRKHVAELY